MQLIFRKATINDGELLLQWRNDPETLRQSLAMIPVTLEGHLRWFTDVLRDENRSLYIAEMDGKPVGTLRVDHEKLDSKELSWTVAPEMRGKGVGGVMLLAARSMLSGELTAKIKTANAASIKIAEAAGFHLRETEKGVGDYCSLPDK
jgi:RimJ/RimL family protein N-acetyltransferase